LVCKSDLAFGLVKNIDIKLLKSVFLVAVPRALTLSVHQLILLIFVGMATMMAAGSVSVFQFAFNLQSVPLTIIGMSYSVAAFPVLADFIAKKDNASFNTHLLTALRHIIFWSLPIVALVVVLRAQIVRVVLGSGAFDWNDTRLTAAVLALFIISLTAQSAFLLIVRAFYAGGKTKIPLIAAIVGAAVSIVTALAGIKIITIFPNLKLALESTFRLEGVTGTEVLVLALAFVIGVLVEMLILLVMAAKEFDLKLNTISRQLLEAFVAAVAAALTSYLTLAFIVDGVNQNTFIGIMLQGGVAGVAGVFAAILAYYLVGSTELKEIYNSYHSRIFKAAVIAPQQDTL
jgi:putative peptidoglycan lipid II flippase